MTGETPTGGGLRLGVMTFPTDRSAHPAELAAAVEARGLSTLLVAEHTHVPLRATPRPRGGEIPDEYRRVLDPFVALTAAAGATSTLRVGTGVCLLGQRDPILTAKATASLDHLSGGRLILGVGFGWHHQEMRDHGVDPARRRSRLREHVLAMRALWTEEVAAFEGEHVSISPSWLWPKPVQHPGPPVLLGADAGPGTFRHIAEWADGWYPNRRYAAIEDDVATLRGAFEAAGRDPASVQLAAFVDEPEPTLLARLARTGFGLAVLPLPSLTLDELVPLLDTYAGAANRLAG